MTIAIAVAGWVLYSSTTLFCLNRYVNRQPSPNLIESESTS